MQNCCSACLVGGNDADNGDDLETFCDNYIALLESLASDDRRLIVSGLLPRKTVNLEPYNEQLKSLCAENDIEFVDHYDSFLLATGEIPASYYWKDKVHLNQTGKRKLLSNIDEICKVTNGQNSSSQRRLFQNFRRGSGTPQRRSPRSSSKFCHIWYKWP
ncbi:MAG: SGNH/GDSL hydrolase family protein [Candidatus Thiodiazotropha sp.]